MLNKLIVLVTGICLIHLQAVAQHRDSSGLKPEDMRKMIEQQKKEIENDRDMDPEQKAMLLKMLNSKKMKDVTEKMDHPDAKMRAAFQLDEKMTSLPMLDKKRMAAIPAKNFTKTQLAQYVNDLYAKLKSTISPEARSNAAKTIAMANGSSAGLNAKALVAWYNGDPQEALLLSAKAVSLSYTINAINNFSAMLNLSGHEEKAVPLLKYALQHDSSNASLYNNLGRAWLGLGEKKKAKQMFLSSVHYSPHQPEANNSLGCLYEAEGDKAAAISSFENSMKGAYNENADEHLSELKPDYDLPKLISFHYTAPKYFDQYAIEVPDECRDIDQHYAVKKMHDAFQNGIAILSNQYSEFEMQAEKDLEGESEKMKNALLNALDNKGAVKISIAPFELLAGKMLVKLAYDFEQDKQLVITNYKKDIAAVIENYDNSRRALEEKFEEEKSKLVFEGEGGRNDEAQFEKLSKEYCDNQKKLADKAQNEAADIHILFKQKYRRIVLDFFNNRIYWAALKSTFPAVVNVETYATIISFLDELKYMSSTTPFVDGHLCALSYDDGTTLADRQFDKVDKPGCPVSVNIGFLVGKLSLDCESFNISGGEGVKLGYKKDFANGQSTISVGAGLTAEIGTKSMKAGVSAEESIFITFDGDGHFCDAGLKMGVGAEAGAGPLSTGADAGYTVSMNSGFNFTNSALSNSINL